MKWLLLPFLLALGTSGCQMGSSATVDAASLLKKGDVINGSFRGIPEDQVATSAEFVITSNTFLEGKQTMELAFFDPTVGYEHCVVLEVTPAKLLFSEELAQILTEPPQAGDTLYHVTRVLRED